MLSEIYNWFTEDFDTADLKEAEALLEELSLRQRENEMIEGSYGATKIDAEKKACYVDEPLWMP
jgi:hypothetical protein